MGGGGAHEAAIYGAMGGHLDRTLAACGAAWREKCWALARAWLDSHLDALLARGDGLQTVWPYAFASSLHDQTDRFCGSFTDCFKKLPPSARRPPICACASSSQKAGQLQSCCIRVLQCLVCANVAGHCASRAGFRCASITRIAAGRA